MALNADEENWVQGLMDAFAEDNSKVSDWELGFMNDQVKRWEEFGNEIRFSLKQWDILDRVAQKLKYEGREQ